MSRSTDPTMSDLHRPSSAQDNARLGALALLVLAVAVAITLLGLTAVAVLLP